VRALFRLKANVGWLQTIMFYVAGLIILTMGILSLVKLPAIEPGLGVVAGLVLGLALSPLLLLNLHRATQVMRFVWLGLILLWLVGYKANGGSAWAAWAGFTGLGAYMVLFWFLWSNKALFMATVLSRGTEEDEQTN